MKTIEEKIAIMQAFAEGKEIERIRKSIQGERWTPDLSPSWNWQHYHYRIKPEPEYTPFTFEDAEFLIGKVVKCKTQDYTAMIISCTQLGTNVDDWKPMLDDFTFLDGSPCGKIKQTI